MPKGLIDCFFCATDSGGIRVEMRMLCQARWRMEPAVNFHLVTPHTLGCSSRAFQRERRIWADERSTSDIYIVADDDCLLAHPSPFSMIATQIMDLESEFSVLALWPTNESIGPWTSAPEGYEIVNNERVLEHAAVGGIRFCRKGHLDEWPEIRTKAARYDGEHAEAIRATGKRVGYFRGVFLNHLGSHYSDTLRR